MGDGDVVAVHGWDGDNLGMRLSIGLGKAENLKNWQVDVVAQLCLFSLNEVYGTLDALRVREREREGE